MPEGRTPAFEQYLQQQQNGSITPKKGRPARAGRLAEASDEMSEKNDDEPELDAVV